MRTFLGIQLVSIRKRIPDADRQLDWADVQREVRDRQVGGEIAVRVRYRDIGKLPSVPYEFDE